MMKDKTTISFLFFAFCGLVISLSAQSARVLTLSITENTSEHDKFLMYIDTIDKYMYRDANIVDQAMERCEEIIQRNIQLSKADIFEYVIQKIYYEQNNLDLLACYEIIKEHEHLLDDETISDKLKDNFTYIRGFTYMTLGDLESAQKEYYGILEKGKRIKDTMLILRGYYSLGQLYGDEMEYESAINCFQKLVDLEETYEVRPSTQSLIDYELSEAYMDLEQFDKAVEVIDAGLNYLEEQKMERLKPDFLLFKGQIALHQNDFDTAEEIYRKVDLLAKSSKDPMSIENSKLFQAKLLEHQGLFQQSLEIYDKIIEEYDSTRLDDLVVTLGEAQVVADKMGKGLRAYDYLLKKSEIEKIARAEEKRQQTAYLKIKFDSEQKEKENQLLAVKILQKQNQNRFLYFIAALFLSGILILFLAFRQKRKYNRILRKEVKTRTQELEHSNLLLNKTNTELEQFNRILSHDLKEPLRSIVGFSHLARKENVHNPGINEYLQFIEKSGKQLHQIIHDVSIFQDIDRRISRPVEWVDTDLLTKNIVQFIKSKNEERAIQIYYSNPQKILVNPSVLDFLFKTIIENGFKFNQSKTPEIFIHYYEENNTHHFRFKDNGIGIPPEFQETIFEMFKRLQTRDDYRGSGLGLSITKKMIESIGGSIRVLKSEEKEGSTFLVLLPKSDTLTEPIPEPENVLQY